MDTFSIDIPNGTKIIPLSPAQLHQIARWAMVADPSTYETFFNQVKEGYYESDAIVIVANHKA